MTKTTDLQEIFALWRHFSERAGTYYTGNFESVKVIAFPNKKQKLSSPDLLIYKEKGSRENLIGRLWVHTSATQNKYLSGYVYENKVVGFFNDDTSSKSPVMRIYYKKEVSQQ